MKKSFSHADNSYIQLFKHRRKLPALTGGDKNNDFIIHKKAKPKIIEIDKIPNSTNAKLDLIISNLQKSNSYITKQFFEDRKLQNENEDLRQRMQALYKKKKIKENNENTEKKKKVNIYGTHEAIKHMLYLVKKFAVDKELVRIKTEQNSKSPPICRYTPNLSYISKHIPSFYFGYNKTSNSKITNENDKVNEKSGIKNISVEEKKNCVTIRNIKKNYKKINFNNSNFKDDITITENNNKSKIKDGNDTANKSKTIKVIKNIIKKPSKIEKNLQNDYLLDKIISKLEKNDKDNNLSIGKYTLNIRTQKIKRNLFKSNETLGIKYNISVPIFDKMTSRQKKIPLKNKNMADYNPNYDAIYPNSHKYIFVNYKMKKKKYKLRKILGSYNTKGEYVLLPMLNK